MAMAALGGMNAREHAGDLREFLKSPEAAAIIEKFGYGIDASS